jgi:hypothetical protein
MRLRIIKLSFPIVLVLLAVIQTTCMNTSPIQPAYSQATHCAEGHIADSDDTFESCTTPGKDPSDSLEICDEEGCTHDEAEISQRDAGRLIGDMYRNCSDPKSSGKLDCEEMSVEPPNNDDD